MHATAAKASDNTAPVVRLAEPEDEPDRAFYRSIGAQAMEEWTVHRVTGEALRALAGRAE